jgi:RimJ/RimL family protein N-acetyltransferase/acyl carrier protein
MPVPPSVESLRGVGSQPYALTNSSYLEGKEVRLRPIDQSDYPFLRALETSPGALVRFRHRGVPTSPENHVQSLWRGVLCQFVVVLRATNKPVGLVTSYGADFRNGRSHIAIIVEPETQGRGSAMEAMRLFIDYLFAVFPLRKLVAEIFEFNWHQFSAGEGRVFATEGVLKEHEFHDGRYWDLYLVAIFRDSWSDLFSRPAAFRAGLLTSDEDRLPDEFSIFASRLAKEFGWSCEELSETTSLEDLGCDSIQYLELVLVVEELIDGEINENILQNVKTLGELFHLTLAFRSE